ncbi:MAG: PilZ domain-containing protein, partial [Rhodanobacter sp.]
TERKRASANVIVTDVISGRVIGHLGDLSSNGMLLISKQSPRSEGLYQVSMTLPASSRTPPSSIEVGIQEQWHEPATTSGQIWAGYRIVAISDADAAKVGSWLAHA